MEVASMVGAAMAVLIHVGVLFKLFVVWAHPTYRKSDTSYSRRRSRIT